MTQKLPILDIELFEEKGIGSDVYVNKFCQHLKRFKDHISKPHKHNFYLIVLFTKGQGIHEVDFETYQVNPGSLFLLSPGQTHHWQLSEDTDGYIFFHTDQFLQLNSNQRLQEYPFFSSIHNPPFLNLREDEMLKVTAQFDELHREFTQPGLFQLNRLSNQVSNLYIDISRIYVQKDVSVLLKNHKYLSTMRKMERMVEEYFRNEKSPSFYANKLHITTNHLNRIINELLGKTSTILITERILLEAKRLLLQTDQSVSQIAYSLGYEDTSYFNRVFKNQLGESPNSFRKRYQ